MGQKTGLTEGEEHTFLLLHDKWPKSAMCRHSLSTHNLPTQFLFQILTEGIGIETQIKFSWKYTHHLCFDDLYITSHACCTLHCCLIQVRFKWSDRVFRHRLQVTSFLHHSAPCGVLSLSWGPNQWSRNCSCRLPSIFVCSFTVYCWHLTISLEVHDRRSQEGTHPGFVRWILYPRHAHLALPCSFSLY